jgi:subtilisin family serine protease
MGATMYGVNFNSNTSQIKNMDGSTPSIPPLNTLSMNVINMSIGASYYDVFGVTGSSISSRDIRLMFNYLNANALSYDQILNGGTSYPSISLTNAVITKAAGNDTTSASNDPLNYMLAYDNLVNQRLLIVGALNNVGTTSAPATIASYSNLAGNDPNIQKRFLVESGNLPYLGNGVAIDGVAAYPNGAEGTSFAAPRVAAYAAIVEQKFPNLSAANTANVLLQTARYDTLSCYYTAAGCPVSTYGQGEASLSRALAPVGRLR